MEGVGRHGSISSSASVAPAGLVRAEIGPVISTAASTAAVGQSLLPAGIRVEAELGPPVPEIRGVEASLGDPQSSGVLIRRRFGKQFGQDITVPSGTLQKVERLFKEVKVLLIQNNAYGGGRLAGPVQDHEIALYKISIDLEKKILRYHIDGQTEVKTVDLKTIFKDETHQIYNHLNELEKSIGAHTTRGGHDIRTPFPSVSEHTGGVHGLRSDELSKISMKDYVTKHLPKLFKNSTNPDSAFRRISKMHTFYEKIEQFFDGEIKKLQQTVATKKANNKDFSEDEANLKKLEERYALIQEADLYAVQTLLAHSDEEITLDGSGSVATTGVFVADRTDVLDRLDKVAERVKDDLRDVARVGKGLFKDRELTPDEIAYTQNVALLAAESRVTQCAYMDKHGLSVDRHMFVERALLKAVADSDNNEDVNFDLLLKDLETSELKQSLGQAIYQAERHIEKRMGAIDDVTRVAVYHVKDHYKSLMEAHEKTKEKPPTPSGLRAEGADIDLDTLPGAPAGSSRSRSSSLTSTRSSDVQ